MVQQITFVQHRHLGFSLLKGLICLAFVFVISGRFIFKTVQAAPEAATTYYVDCQSGNDNNVGKGTGNAWKTLDRANQATLVPGDSLLLKRGCSWAGKLVVSWNGTASARIKIGAYGSGPRPLIYNRPEDLNNRFHNNVLITGSNLIIEQLATTIVNPPTDPNCGNNPVGFYIGFNFVNADNSPTGASYNILRNVEAYGHTAGIHINSGANNNRIVFNTITENRAMSILTPKAQNPTDDLGAWGILVKGNNNEIARNYLANNNALCTYDTTAQGNSIEIYEAQNNQIHHNMAVNDRVFSELGGSSTKRANNNTYYYNVIVSNSEDARFIVARGNGNQYGPTLNTRVFHNTVYFTNPRSQGIVCGANCDATILNVQGNIIWAEEKAIFADGAINERFNLFWSSNATPMIQLMSSTMDPTSIIADPRFANPGSRDFTLLPTSRAIDAAKIIRCTKDINNNSVPANALPDVGATEWQAPLSRSLASAAYIGADIDPAGYDEASDALLEENLYQTLLPLVIR